MPLGQMLKTTLIDWANDLIDSYDLEEETIEDVIRILKEEFED